MKRKVQRYRGSKTHGSGSMKKRRGAGHRGGRGNAGSGKRGDAKKPSYWNKKQLKPKSKKRIGINVSSLDKNLSVWLDQTIKRRRNKRSFKNYYYASWGKFYERHGKSYGYCK